jgi:hypothetical protein
MITLHTTVHDGGITLLSNPLLGDLRVNPVRETPHGVINFAEFNRSAGIVLHGSLEVIVEVAVVQEDIGVVIPAVEMTLDGLERLDHTIQFLVSGENDERGVGTGFLVNIGADGHAASSEDLVMLLADFTVEEGTVSNSSYVGSLHLEVLGPAADGDTYRMEGGVPAGIRIPPGDAGCRTNRRRIKTITRHGNSNTKPRGIEIDEFPFKRMRRRKKANRGEARPLSRDASSIGRLGALGSRFAMR